jgi:hypothetical protein
MNLPEFDLFLKIKMVPRQIVFRVLLFGTVLAGVFWLDTEQHDSPWFYHNDEPSKVQQIQSGERNLRHPPLMLTLTDLLATMDGATQNPQAVVELGRGLSAFCMALALALMVDWALIMVHPVTALGLLLALPFHSGLFEAGHYFKEDALFLCGVALSIRAQAFWAEKPRLLSALFLGIALCVLAGSKYVGCLVLLPLLTHLFWFHKAPRDLKWKFGLVVVLGMILVYWPALIRLKTGTFFLTDEISVLVAGDYGAGRAVPHAFYWKMLCHDFSLPFILVGVTAYIIAMYRQGRPGFCFMPWFCFLAMLGLACASKYSERYLWPVLLLVMTLLICGPVLLAQSFFKREGRQLGREGTLIAVGLASSLFLLTLNLPDFLRCREGFFRDSRQELVQWMKHHLDANQVVLAEDTLAKVDVPEYDERTWKSYFVADLGSLEELRSYGVTHLIISYDVYHRFVDGSVATTGGGRQLFEQRRHFYTKILQEGILLWSEEARDPKALHPGLKLIEIPQISLLRHKSGLQTMGGEALK